MNETMFNSALSSRMDTIDTKSKLNWIEKNLIFRCNLFSNNFVDVSIHCKTGLIQVYETL